MNAVSRGCVLIVAILLTVGAHTLPARAAPYAAIVMDMRNGKVLHARSADRRLHPASLTKMMTLYLTFEAVRDGRLRLDQRVRVSRHAARQPASKLYLRAGQRVTVRSLIRATAIKSANDAAMVLAEAIGGSQRGFARMMTRKAHRMGMRNTAFKNPHGLTQRGHYSSARDMAQLGRRLFHDYPKYYNIFRRKSDQAAGKRIWTTNRMLSTYRGADGIKTGYTRAAGYNLVASAKRGSRRILGVVFGASSSSARARRMAALLDMGFERAPRHARVVKPRNTGGRVQVARSPVPKAKPEWVSGLAALSAAVSPTAQAAERPAPARAPEIVSAVAPLRTAIPRPRPKTDAGGRKPARKSAEQKTARLDVPVPATRPGADASSVTSAVPVPRAKPVPGRVEMSRLVPAQAAAARKTGWAIQVGAYKTESRARVEMREMRLQDMSMLSSGEIGISPGFGRARSRVYRIRVTGLKPDVARRACVELRTRGRGCAPIAPGSW